MRTVADIMTADPDSANPETTLKEALTMMKRHSCRQLPVVVSGRLAGIVTDRDIRLAMNSPFVLHERGDDESLMRNITVADCMTANPLTVDADAPASHAADLMNTYKFGGLPVIRDGKLVGIVTVSDILRSYIEISADAEEPTS
jgi:acetoin utilization protein AcuB